MVLVMYQYWLSQCQMKAKRISGSVQVHLDMKYSQVSYTYYLTVSGWLYEFDT